MLISVATKSATNSIDVLSKFRALSSLTTKFATNLC